MPIGPIDDIEREPVESSNIKAIGYSNTRNTLAIEFKSGDVFHYAPVSPELAVELYAAESKGKFYAANIKGKIDAKLMTGICSSCGGRGVLELRCAECGGKVVERERRRLTSEEKAIEAREARR